MLTEAPNRQLDIEHISHLLVLFLSFFLVYTPGPNFCSDASCAFKIQSQKISLPITLSNYTWFASLMLSVLVICKIIPSMRL